MKIETEHSAVAVIHDVLRGTRRVDIKARRLGDHYLALDCSISRMWVETWHVEICLAVKTRPNRERILGKGDLALYSCFSGQSQTRCVRRSAEMMVVLKRIWKMDSHS